MPDCGDSSCLYAPLPRTGMRTNGGCRCDDCPECGAKIRRAVILLGVVGPHRQWCSQPDWIPEHHRKPAGTETK